MKLVSDFHDYYDHAFDLNGVSYKRLSKSGLSKKGQFEFLHQNNFLVPPYGKVEEVLGSYWNSETSYVDKVVVYENEFSHRGEDKVLCNEAKAKKYFGMLSSAYLPTCKSLSLRLLSIGSYKFWLEYRSNDSWRSNCGDVIISLIGRDGDFGDYKSINEPLYAIDFIIGKELYAVDYNIAPGVAGTGIEKILTPREVVDEISKYIS